MAHSATGGPSFIRPNFPELILGLTHNFIISSVRSAKYKVADEYKSYTARVPEGRQQQTTIIKTSSNVKNIFLLYHIMASSPNKKRSSDGCLSGLVNESKI